MISVSLLVSDVDYAVSLEVCDIFFRVSDFSENIFRMFTNHRSSVVFRNTHFLELNRQSYKSSFSAVILSVKLIHMGMINSIRITGPRFRPLLAST